MSSSRVFYVRFPKTKEETAVWGAYVSLLPLAYAIYAEVCVMIANAIRQFPCNKITIDSSVLRVAPFILIPLFLIHKSGYLRFPLLVLTPVKLCGIHFLMGLPLPFCVALDEYVSVEEVSMGALMPPTWTVALKKGNGRKCRLWIGDHIVVSPFLKEHQRLIYLLTKRLSRERRKH